MEYIKILEKEMQEVLEQLKPHFEEYGVLKKNNCYIELLINGKKEAGFIYYVVLFKTQGIDNNMEDIYKYTDLNIEDIFEEVGDNLKELKIKPVPKFDVNEWKKGFAKRHNLRLTEYLEVCKEDYIIIDGANETSYEGWHYSIFSNKHKIFSLDCCNGKYYLKTEKDCEEFERIYIIINNYLNNLPDLNEEENNEIRRKQIN